MQVGHGVHVDPVKVPQGLVTPARAKRFKESLLTFVHAVQEQQGPFTSIEGIDLEDSRKPTKVLVIMVKRALVLVNQFLEPNN